MNKGYELYGEIKITPYVESKECLSKKVETNNFLYTQFMIKYEED